MAAALRIGVPFAHNPRRSFSHPARQDAFVKSHLPRLCAAFEAGGDGALAADHGDPSWKWVDSAVPTGIAVSGHPHPFSRASLDSPADREPCSGLFPPPRFAPR